MLAGWLLGWGTTAAVLLGGVCWVSSSGIIAKVLTDLDRLGNRETPAVLNLLVVEDLAMAGYLPVAAALVAGTGAAATARTVAVALTAAGAILVIAVRWGPLLSRALVRGSDESLLLSVFGLTLLVGGLAQRLQVSAAIGAFLVGLALSGPVVTTFVPPLPATGPSCVVVDRDVLSRLRAHPSDFYVDVHDAEFPDGALRGQLEKA